MKLPLFEGNNSRKNAIGICATDFGTPEKDQHILPEKVKMMGPAYKVILRSGSIQIDQSGGTSLLEFPQSELERGLNFCPFQGF